MLNRLIGGTIVVLVGCSLLPEVSRQVQYGTPTERHTPSVNNHTPHKQTYLEYVKERLMVERMMKR